MKEAISWLMLTLLLASLLPLALNIQPVKASGTIYIRADGSIEGTDKITTTDYITYIFIDNVYDSIVVERNNIVIDGNGYALQGTGSGTGVDLSGRTNVTVQNTQIQSFSYGIMLYSSSNNSISGNTITNNWYGIWLYCSSNNSISGNTITNNRHGIWFDSSSNFNSISGNNITANNGWGIVFVSSSNFNCINGNNITSNGWDGIRLGSSSNNITRNNIANNEDGIGLYDSFNNCIAGNNITANSEDGIWLYCSSNNSISGNTITNNGSGIRFQGSSNNSISKNNIRNNGSGIWLGYFFWSSFNNSISGNTVTDNRFGIVLESSSNNIVSGNTITNNGSGIRLQGCSSNNSVRGNTVTNNWIGIVLSSSSNNSVSGNTITNNEYGIELVHHSGNVGGNNITNNHYGIWLCYSFKSVIYHNNFVDNLQQVYIQPPGYPSNNFWDDGYPSGGNYWSDYTGTDIFSGPYQNETGSDGIGDTPYIIDANNQDRYPLMNLWAPAPTPPTPPDISAIVDFQPQALNLRSKGKWITAYIELPEGYNVESINVSSTILEDTVSVGPEAPTEIGDYDEDGVPDLMVKFDRAEVRSCIHPKISTIQFVDDLHLRMNITLTITGMLNDGTSFQGTDTITIIYGISRIRLITQMLRYEAYMQSL